MTRRHNEDSSDRSVVVMRTYEIKRRAVKEQLRGLLHVSRAVSATKERDAYDYDMEDEIERIVTYVMWLFTGTGTS